MAEPVGAVDKAGEKNIGAEAAHSPKRSCGEDFDDF